MPSLSDTITRLNAWRAMGAADTAPTSPQRLAELEEFGSNPGALRGKVYLPRNLLEGAPLVVVLHGCTQTADGYDTGAGWSQLADRHGFALLFPEQQRRNNPNLCFNWFNPDDCRRDTGEALSIRQMIDAVVANHAVDPARIFVTGLSAGGAMASVMLATYPEIFAGGAIIAGLPFGCASTVPAAFDRMRGHGLPDAAQLAATVLGASQHQWSWPLISVWHGSGDPVVNPNNAAAIVGQWRGVHGLAAEPTRIEAVDGYPRQVWCDADGREVIEEYSITGMGHGTPLDTTGSAGWGVSGPYMLEASISSTLHICRFFGLAGEPSRPGRDNVPADNTAAAKLPEPATSTNRSRRVAPEILQNPASTSVAKVIEDAMRAAGLIR